MGRWPIKNTFLFEKASDLTGDRIKIFSSNEPGFIWIVAVDLGKSYNNFWTTYKILELENNKVINETTRKN